MKDKKAAKLILKRAKKHPELYSTSDIIYAKLIRKRLKQNAISHKKTECTEE